MRYFFKDTGSEAHLYEVKRISEDSFNLYQLNGDFTVNTVYPIITDFNMPSIRQCLRELDGSTITFYRLNQMEYDTITLCTLEDDL